MEHRVSELLKKIKYEEGFPPTGRASTKLGELAGRGIAESPSATGVIAQVYFESIERVINRLSDILIQNADQFELTSSPAIEVAVNKALDSLFVDARGLLTRTFRGLGTEQFAMTALDEKRGGLMDYLRQKVMFRGLRTDSSPSDAPAPTVTDGATREFTFIRDQRLREVVERDYREVDRANSAKCWKSVIILSGGAIEAILLDLLISDPRAITAKAAPKKKTDITSWDLKDLIDVSVELRLVGRGIEKLSHPVREYRNLVHPGNEIRNGLAFGEPEARIAIEVLHMLHRDLIAPSP